MVADLNAMPECSDDSRSSSDKGNQSRNPKKIHKAEREKLKRDHLNELFIKLGHTLEPTHQNAGKASILGDATKLLKELVMQVEYLRRENVTLLNESLYVTQEKNDLKDETAILVAEIKKLHHEIRERSLFKPASGKSSDGILPVLRHAAEVQAQQPTRVVGPMYVMEIRESDGRHHSNVGIQPFRASKPSCEVKRPHARYPTPSDSWPNQILAHRMNANAVKGDCRSMNENDGIKELKLLD